MREPKSKVSYIYRLRDPRTGQIVYIGATVDPKRRLTQIMSPTMVGRSVIMWVLALKSARLEVKMEIIEECGTAVRRERELHWINYYKDTCDLLNHDGVKRPYSLDKPG